MGQTTDEILNMIPEDPAAFAAAQADINKSNNGRKAAPCQSGNFPTEGDFAGAIELNRAEDEDELEDKKYYTFKKTDIESGRIIFLKIPCSTEQNHKSWGWIRQEHDINLRLVETGCPHIIKYEKELATYKDGRPYIKADFVRGENLGRLSRVRRKIPEGRVRQFQHHPQVLSGRR